jgi:hypothetical protein
MMWISLPSGTCSSSSASSSCMVGPELHPNTSTTIGGRPPTAAGIAEATVAATLPDPGAAAAGGPTSFAAFAVELSPASLMRVIARGSSTCRFGFFEESESRTFAEPALDAMNRTLSPFCTTRSSAAVSTVQ